MSPRMSAYSRHLWQEMTRPQVKEAAMPKTPTQITEESIEERNALAENMAERQAVEAIKPYVEARDEASKAKKAQDAASLVIKTYMETRGLAELDDPEYGLRAVLSTVSNGKDRWDVRSMPAALVKKLAAAGCLTVDKDALRLDANTPLRMDAQLYHVPAGVTARLHVEEIK